MEGVLIRQLLTFQFRSDYWPTLLALTLGAMAALTFSFIDLVIVVNPRNWSTLTGIIPSIVNLAWGVAYGTIGFVTLANIVKNVRHLMEPAFAISDLDTENESVHDQCAALLIEGFREHWPDAWPDLESARSEMQEALGEERIARVAMDKDGQVLGWIGGIPDYDGHVWELHPLVVKADCQRQGVGRALVKDFENQVRMRDGLTIMLGSDDEDGMTSLANVNLYENLWEKIRTIQNLKGHPYEFYQKLGYVITGVVVDANGRGKPDILMSKRVG